MDQRWMLKIVKYILILPNHLNRAIFLLPSCKVYGLWPHSAKHNLFVLYWSTLWIQDITHYRYNCQELGLLYKIPTKILGNNMFFFSPKKCVTYDIFNFIFIIFIIQGHKLKKKKYCVQVYLLYYVRWNWMENILINSPIGIALYI